MACTPQSPARPDLSTPSPPLRRCIRHAPVGADDDIHPIRPVIHRDPGAAGIYPQIRRQGGRVDLIDWPADDRRVLRRGICSLPGRAGLRAGGPFVFSTSAGRESVSAPATGSWTPVGASKTVSPLQRLRSCRSVRTLIEIGIRIESWDVAGRLGAQASVAEAFGAHEAMGETGLAGRGAAGLGRLHHVAVEAGLSTGRHRTVSSRSRTAAVVPGSGASPERTRIASSGEPSRRQLVRIWGNCSPGVCISLKNP